MKFERVQAVRGEETMGEGFADALFYDLADEVEKLPLERFCTKGGWPLNAKISTIAILENRPEKLVAVVYVSFTETGAACCSGDNFEHEHFEELSLLIDKSNWTCDFPASV